MSINSLLQYGMEYTVAPRRLFSFIIWISIRNLWIETRSVLYHFANLADAQWSSSTLSDKFIHSTVFLWNKTILKLKLKTMLRQGIKNHFTQPRFTLRSLTSLLPRAASGRDVVLSFQANFILHQDHLIHSHQWPGCRVAYHHWPKSSIMQY